MKPKNEDAQNALRFIDSSTKLSSMKVYFFPISYMSITVPSNGEIMEGMDLANFKPPVKPLDTAAIERAAHDLIPQMEKAETV